MQRHGVGLAADTSRNHCHRAKLTQGPGITQDDAVDQTPLDVRQGDIPEGLPAVGPQRQRGLFLFLALLLHQRDQLAGDKGHGAEGNHDNDAGHGKNDAYVIGCQPWPEPTL